MGNIIDLQEEIVKRTFNKIAYILYMAQVNGVEVELQPEDLIIILMEFYKDYERKNRIYEYSDSMVKYFSIIVDTDYYVVDLIYVLRKLRAFELKKSKGEKARENAKRLINIIHNECMRSGYNE